mgnify:CR=1 FL=1
MTDPRHALVVDDHPTNRLLAAALLRKLGWTVFEAASGEAALALAAQQSFRLVLLDISMPGLSGEDTCARLRAAHSTPAIHIVAYTAHAFLGRRTGSDFGPNNKQAAVAGQVSV